MPEATKTAGGRISGRLFLTMEATTTLAVGDPVMVSADYTVIKCDGTKPCIGFVEVANFKRVLGNYPVGYAPGTVTIEVRGHAVRTLTAGGTLVVGAVFGVGAAGALLAIAGGVVPVGIALMAATVGNKFDALIGPSA